MSEEIISSLEILKNFVLESKSEIDSRDKIIKNLQEKYNNLEEDYQGLKKVSIVASLSKQVNNKNDEIVILQRQLSKLKNNNKPQKSFIKKEEPSLKTEQPSLKNIDDSDSEDDEYDGYELIEHEDTQFLKDIDTRKLYYLTDGKKGKYAGKQSKKGKIKLK